MQVLFLGAFFYFGLRTGLLGFDLGERKARVFDGGLYVGSGGEGGWEGSGEGK